MRCDGGLGEKKKRGGKRGLGVVDCVPKQQTNRTHRSRSPVKIDFIHIYLYLRCSFSPSAHGIVISTR